MKIKIKVNLIGENGNIFNLVVICRGALIEYGKKQEAYIMTERALKANNYNEALSIIQEYVEIE